MTISLALFTNIALTMKTLAICMLFLVPSLSHEDEKELLLSSYGNHYCIELTVNATSCWFIVDTGASFSIVYGPHAKHLGLKKAGKSDIQLKDFGGGNSSLYLLKGFDARIQNRRLPLSYWYLANNNMVLPQINGIQPVGVIGMSTLRRIKARITFGQSPKLIYTLQ